MRVLIVDDDQSLRRLVGAFLAEEGFDVHEAHDATSMRRVMAAADIEILILDVMMPGEDGLSIARTLTRESDAGIIMVSARGAETDRIVGLEVGADDYLTKPLSPRELLARIRALQRRRQSAGGQRIVTGYKFEGWRLDPARRILRDQNEVVIGLSEGEFGLLLAFVEHPHVVLSRDELLELARGSDSDAFDRAIDTQVSRLRRKLCSHLPGEIIRTVRNKGYIFLPQVTRA